MAPAVSLRGAVALAGRFPALAGVDLAVEAGQIVVLLGPNGAGKTSLLRACCGLVPVTSGEAVVLGEDVAADPGAVRGRVGFLGHHPALYDELSARENVRFAVRAAGRPASLVEPALERVGVVGRLARTPAERLSAGQRRRVALAALVARDPELWLLDEPHAGLDARARAGVDELVAEVAASGRTVLLSSHEHELVAPLADRVVTLAGGRVTAEARGGRRAALSAVPAPEVATGGANVA